MLSSGSHPTRWSAPLSILITGLGYIGSCLAESLLEQGQAVLALENYFCTPRSALRRLAKRPGLTIISGSINNPRALGEALSRAKARAVVHLAAQPSAHPEAASAHYTELTNVVGARLTLEAALRAGVERVVIGSSFKVYGDDLPKLVREDQPYGEMSDLAHLSKIYAEKLAEMMAATQGLRSVSVRLGIVYGLSPVMKQDPRFMTVPNRFAQLAARDQPLTVHASAVRPAGFIHVQDASKALQAALETSSPQPYCAVNAVTECLTVSQIAASVQAAARARGLNASIEGAPQSLAPKIKVESSLPAELFKNGRTVADSIGEVLDYFSHPNSARRQ